jgi:ATP-dependent helicase/nuclease subunit A
VAQRGPHRPRGGRAVTEARVDHEAQDEETRRLIREALDATLFVEAGAGTGKTRALVDRFVALVMGGAPVDRIVAITFTEKAAAELKDRIRGQLEEILAGDPDNERVKEALDSLDRAQISTIHAFGQALLRSFAAEAGVDPAFAVQDEVLADRRLQERWRGYLEELASDEAAVAVVDRVLNLGLTTRDLETLARELAEKAHLAAPLEASPLTAPAPAWPDVEALRTDLLDALPNPLPDGERLRPRLDKLLGLLEALRRAPAERESVLAAGVAVLGQSFNNVGRADDWGSREAIGRLRETGRRICDALRETLAACRSHALADLIPYVVRFAREDAVVRGREGTLTFDDLILRPRDLLRESQDAVRALRERYDAMLIDEFQDTDPLQVDIALAFATNPDSDAVEPGRLFLVGDPKQSIYRFRRADMAIYSLTRDDIERSGGRFPQLTLSRRSRQVILDWVNAVFDSVIDAGDEPTVQPPYREIHAARSDSLRGPGVACAGDGLPELNARQVRQHEAAQVAARCRAVLSEGWQVAERDGTVRPARFRDIAILMPTRAILPPLERALADAGVPYRVEGGSLIYRTQEVRDLINCLTAIDDPADEVAVVAALRSPAFACSDVDLARHAAHGRFNYLDRRLERQKGPVADALRTLAGHHYARHRHSLVGLVERFAADRGQVEVGLLDQADRNSFRRMRFIAEQARAFEAGGPESLRAFVSWLEHRATDQILDYEGAGLDDEDAVRVLTIHAAKGLEFPIVFLAGLGSGPNPDRNAFHADHARGRIAVSIGAKSRSARFVLGDAEEIDHLEQRHTAAEYARLLYVAATRARDHLVAFLYHPARAHTSGARRLIEAGAREGAEALSELPVAESVPSAPFADLTVEPPDFDSPQEFADARQRAVEAALRERYTSATALGPLRKDEATDESEPWSRGRGGTRLGRAVHAALQSLPLDAVDAAVEAFSRAQAVAEAIPERAHEVARLVRRALQSEAAARARRAPRALREVPFAFRSDGLVLEGFVDLVIETPQGIEIVDWKTDDIPPEEVRERLREYKLQAGLYVLGMEAAVQRPVTRITYVFARAGVEESPGEPASLAATARERVREEAG